MTKHTDRLRAPFHTRLDLEQIRRYLSPAQLSALPPVEQWRTTDFALVRQHLQQIVELVATYLPRYLVNLELGDLQRDSLAASGEFLRGTLAFADISGFTAMSERLSTLGREGAEQVTDIVNGYFRRMLSIIFEHGGDVFKFGGDALLVFYPDAAAPGIQTALQASWQMQRAMADFSEVKTSLGSFPLRMKIGLSAGSIFTARLGPPADRQFIVAGQVVNATAQAESLSSAGEILITPKAYAALAEPHVPFAFTPGPHGHQRLAAAVERPGAVASQPAWDQINSFDDLLAALDHLSPYLPGGLLPRLVSDPAQQQASGEHRLVGVLFSNFLGATELIEQWGPDRADEIAGRLNGYVTGMQTAIRRYGGVVSKIDLYDHGDKLMAIFGAPLAHEDDAERALRAALEMQAVEQAAGPAQFVQSIGVNAGVVFAGHMGSAERREYTVMGDDVNLAARLMGAARPGELLLSTAISRKVAAYFELADRGTVMVKGKVRPVPIFSVTGPRAQPELVRGIQGLRSPLVGRDVEIQTLRRLAAEVRADQGRILVLMGEAGLGKSRLINELRAGLGPGDYAFFESHCLSYTQSVSYSAFTDMVRRMLALTSTDSESEAWAKLRQRVAELFSDETGSDILPYLAHFLSLPLPETLAERVTYLAGEALQRQVIRAVVTLIERQAERRPLLLVFDDLHFADSASLAMLERVLALAERAPILLALLYRPDRSHGCWPLGEEAARLYPQHCTLLTLRPLDVQAGEDQLLVRHLLSLETLPPELVQLIGRAEGNPFYVEEIVRTLIEADAIARRDDQWQVVGALGLTAVPDSLQGIIMARIDRLMHEARRTLQLGSVIGRTFRYLVLNWLASAVSLAVQLDQSLTALQRAELIRERTRVPELEYAFTRVMFRDVAYESLLLRDRRVYHGLVGRQLEETHDEAQREEVYELLAHHYSLSDDQAKALDYLIKAGDKTRLAYANKEAIGFYEQAQPLAQQVGGAGDRASVAEGLGDVLYHVGEYDGALAHFERALTLRTDPRQRADLYRRIGAVNEKRGDYEAALKYCAAGLQLLEPAHIETVEMARLLTLECRVHHQQGQFDKAVEDGEQALSIIEDTSAYQEIAQAHNELGNAYEGKSLVDEAIFHYERSLLILERIGDEHGASKLYNNLALMYYQSDLTRAEDYVLQSLHTMQRLGDVWGESTAYQNLGIIQYGKADYAHAVEYYARSLSMKERLGDTLGIADCCINLGEAYRARGDNAQAIAHLEKGLRIARQIGASQAEAECHRQLAECYLEIGDYAKALDVSQQALSHARQIGDRKEEGIVNRVLGTAYRQLHAGHKAVNHFAQSETILRELNREFDLGATLYEYGLALKGLNQSERAHLKLREALAIFERLQLPQEQARVQAALEKQA